MKRGLIINKSLILLFVVVSMVVAGLNNTIGKSGSESVREIVHWTYLVFEYFFRTLIVIISSIITINLLKKRKSRVKMFKNSIRVFILFMVTMLCIVPVVTGLWDLGLVLMPIPWSTIPLQLLKDGHFFSMEFEKSSLSIIIFAYWIYQAFIFISTLIYGRRVQCSMFCLFCGVHAESFYMAAPVIKTGLKKGKFFSILKWMLFSINILLFIFMAFDLLDLNLLRDIEMIKYLSLEVIFFQLFFIFLSGRGYCYYCPAGTMLGLVSKIAGQRIITNLTSCIECNLCNRSCDMKIDIVSKAKIGETVSSLDCVGCGHCVDICPKKTLKYATWKR